MKAAPGSGRWKGRDLAQDRRGVARRALLEKGSPAGLIPGRWAVVRCIDEKRKRSFDTITSMNQMSERLDSHLKSVGKFLFMTLL